MKFWILQSYWISRSILILHLKVKVACFQYTRYYCVHNVCFDIHYKIFMFHLLSKANVFESMLASGMRESIEHCITFSNISQENLKSFLHFIYSNSISIINHDNATDFLLLSNQYAIPFLQLKTEFYLIEHFDLEKFNISHLENYCHL